MIFYTPGTLISRSSGARIQYVHERGPEQECASLLLHWLALQTKTSRVVLRDYNLRLDGRARVHYAHIWWRSDQ